MYKAEEKEEAKKAMPPEMKEKMEAKEEEEKAKKAKKAKDDKDEMDKSVSTISEDELSKSCEALEELVKGSLAGRKQELLKKAGDGSADDDEIKELRRLLKGKQPDSTEEQIEKSMATEGNEDLAKSIDVSDYLGEFHKSMTDSLSTLAKSLDKVELNSDQRTVALAKALLAVVRQTQRQEQILKSMADHLGGIRQQPVRGPRGAQNMGQAAARAEAIEKGLGGAPVGNRAQLSKNDVLDTLTMLLEKSLSTGSEGMSALAGERYDEAATKYEMTNQISPAMLSEVIQFRRGGRP